MGRIAIPDRFEYEYEYRDAEYEYGANARDHVVHRHRWRCFPHFLNRGLRRHL